MHRFQPSFEDCSSKDLLKGVTMKDRYLPGTTILNPRTFQPKRLGDEINWRLLALRGVVIVALLLGLGGAALFLWQAIQLIFAPITAQPKFHKMLLPIFYIAISSLVAIYASDRIHASQKRSK